jgi:hypothetical protein
MQTAGDGYLDSHELPPALYGLLNYDANGDGRISAAEYLGALRQVQLEMSLDQQYAAPPSLSNRNTLVHVCTRLCLGCLCSMRI